MKRLIGLPGDRIAVVDGRLVINGETVPVTSRSARPSGRQRAARSICYLEQLDGCSHYVLDDPNWPTDDMDEITVKPGRYFFMGDNRDNSYDGRRVGTVRAEELAGPRGCSTGRGTGTAPGSRC